MELRVSKVNSASKSKTRLAMCVDRLVFSVEFSLENIHLRQVSAKRDVEPVLLVSTVQFNLSAAKGSLI